MSDLPRHGLLCCRRRDFLQAMGTAAGGAALLSNSTSVWAVPDKETARQKRAATVRGAFLYPPSETLRREGYWSWPGSTFNPEGHQKQYMVKIRAMVQNLGMPINMEEKPLDEASSVTRFISEVKQASPDGLLLIPFKKGHWEHVVRIVEETRIPTVVLATLGVLLVDHIHPFHRKTGVYLINAMDDLGAVQEAMKMIRTARRMKESLLLNIVGKAAGEMTVRHLGTRVRTIPLEQFYTEYKQTEASAQVKQLARSYLKNAKEVVEPSETDVVDAARVYFALKKIIDQQQADAIMMDCLPGLRHPRQHVPPCMGFMSLRDEGIPAGCQAALNPTLTQMLVRELFDKPGFQQNASMETERNLFFGAHCTSPTRMNGIDVPAEPYILRNHAEAGWGCVPQVLFPSGQEVTMVQYLSGEVPKMLVYSGKIVRCYPKAAGGCRTNVEMTINEMEDVCDVKGMHQIIFYGNHARQLRTFCQLHGIEVVT